MQINVIPNDMKLDVEFLKFLKRVDGGTMYSWHRRIVASRERNLTRARNGALPTFMQDQTANSDVWQAELPDWLADQRNQMTGPADNAELAVKMINSGSPGVMLDLEDSMANKPDNILNAYLNVKRALCGSLSYFKTDKFGGQQRIFATTENGTVIFTRVRGLHMEQAYPDLVRLRNVTSASLFDLCMLFYNLDLEDLEHPPCIYIPKSESAHEAKWWREAFRRIEKQKGWKFGTIKCMALVEAHSLAYEMEEFAFNLQPYLIGLNLGRWDYMASLIDYMYNQEGWIFPDRNAVPHDVPFFQNLRHWMAHVCHKHGMLAIGGMSALFPDRKNEERNELALTKLKADKENEAACLMDGAWTGHPDQNEIAVASFPEPNQLDKMPGLTELPDLREFNNDLPVTEEGTREAIRTCIQYRQGVNRGKGASLINGYMEDLATDRIYRIMICQRIDMGVHSYKEVVDMFNDEVKKLGKGHQTGYSETLNLITSRQHNPR